MSDVTAQASNDADADETTHLAAAREGDRKAFDALVRPHLVTLERMIIRMVADPEDARDLVQDTLIKAWSGLSGFAGRARFKTWLVGIAIRTALDHLRNAGRWRKRAQIAYANRCSGDPALSMEVGAALMAPDAAFEVREHIAFCLTCVGRSLPPEEQAALVLRDLEGLDNAEAARALGVSVSVLRHRLSAARTAMQETYAGLCALVGKGGACWQCAGLRGASPEGRRGDGPPQLGELIGARLAIARSVERSEATAGLHAVFARRLAEQERLGLGEGEATSDCGSLERDGDETPR
jgi:RNA polymerase sigma-70 factor (ECF subfamily)